MEQFSPLDFSTTTTKKLAQLSLPPFLRGSALLNSLFPFTLVKDVSKAPPPRL